ncbi:MAG: DsbC family protein [Burkholderiaceae bacterium]
MLALSSAWAVAETSQELAVKKMIEPRLGSGAKVDSVTRTPYSGLFEVRVGSDILYTDEKAKYLFIGRILDTTTYQDYTKTRVDEVSKIKFSDLPLASAMKVVKGNGKRVIAVFEDPNCGYCKRFDKSLQEVDNITVYTFLYNILSEDSVTKARDIWCSADRSKAWDNWMLNGKAAPAAAAGCATPHEKVLALGKQLKVTGTPTIFFADGTRIPGAIDVQGLEAKLATVK